MTDQLSLRKIDESNFIACFNLELGPGQERFVSHPIRSLAQAYVYYSHCTPFAIYRGDVMVGYVMVLYDPDERTYNIWHLMVDQKCQNQGCGQKALALCLDYIRTQPFGKSDVVLITCDPQNTGAMHIYEKFGFSRTHRDEEDEVELSLTI